MLFLKTPKIGVTARVDNGRTVEWQHLHHVAHMFLFNAYKIQPAKKAGSLDVYLKKYGLHRPLLNHPNSPESWHIEATT